MRLSIQSTYDRRKTGDRYFVTSHLNGELVCDRESVEDPFIHHRITIHWWDALKCLLQHGKLVVEVLVGGDRDIIEDVLELDENYIGHGSTRRHEFQMKLDAALTNFCEH